MECGFLPAQAESVLLFSFLKRWKVSSSPWKWSVSFFPCRSRVSFPPGWQAKESAKLCVLLMIVEQESGIDGRDGGNDIKSGTTKK
jgi:hypothetical protein